MSGAKQLAAVVAILVSLGGCTVGPDYHRPGDDLPAAFVAASPGQPAAELGAWWDSFDDPELSALVAGAIAANPDLEIALDRLQEARTAEAVVMSAALPEAGVSGATGRGTGSDLTRGRADEPLTSADNAHGGQVTQAVGFDADWQLDLFGQVRREAEAAGSDVQAAAAARDDVLIAVVADVAQAYFDLRGLEMRLAVLRQSVATARQTADLVQTRYDRGLTNELDVTLAQRELATLQAELDPLAARIDAARDSIAVLIGQYPEKLAAELAKPGVIPPLPPQVRAGVPADLLRRRPDIVEAERQLAASTARIGVATADLFPHLGLTGAAGWQGLSGAAAAASPFVWAVGPAASWSLLDFGALDAKVDIADLRSKEFLVRYKRTVLEAVREVDTASADYAAQQDRLGHLSDALAAGQRSITLASERYDRGLTDFLNVLDAQRQEYDLEDQYAGAEQQAANALVALYKGLGGGWEQHQSIPPIRQPQPAVIAMFDRLLKPQS